MAKPAPTRRRERRSDLAVAALVAVALLLGLVVRHRAVYATVPFERDGISGECPAGWLRAAGSDPVLRVEDTRGGAFSTVFELRTVVLAAGVEPSVALDVLGLGRAGRATSHVALGSDTVEVSGQTAMRREFVYVHDDPNPYVQRMPVVVRGVDVALRAEGRVIVATLLASTEEFDSQQALFYRFVESLEYEGDAED